MRIDRNTKIYGSFSGKAGNTGCRLFNAAFNYYRLNCLYKSFSIRDIGKAVEAARTLDFKGFAVSMPFKREVLEYVDEVSDEVSVIQSANTVTNERGVFKAHNTDYISAQTLLNEHDSILDPKLYVLGNGGYAAAVKHAAENLNIPYDVITRENWDDIGNIRNSIVFNCTPVKVNVDKSNFYINSNVASKTGLRLSKIQAAHQFKLYTGLEFPFSLK